MVGENKWQHGIATFCKPFTAATIRYFDHVNAAEAWRHDLPPIQQGLRVNP
jgi:hypothetical protein